MFLGTIARPGFAMIIALATAAALPSAPAGAAPDTQPLQTTVLQFGQDTGDHEFASNDPAWRIQSAGPKGLEVELRVPALSRQELRADGRTWQRLDIAGAAELAATGQPGLPVLSRLVAVPAGMALTVTVLDATATQVPDLTIYPVQAPDGGAFSFDANAYRQSRPAPARPEVQVGRPAIMAGQTVVPLTVRAVSYDAAGSTATVWNAVRLRLDFIPDPQASSAAKSGHRRPLPRSFAGQLADEALGFRELEAAAAAEPAKLNIAGVGFGTYVAVHCGLNNVATGIAPLLEWRREQGYHVVEVDASQVGNTTTAIRDALQAIYDNPVLPPLEFVAIFGDVDGSYPVPAWTETLSGYNGGGDHYYTMLDGDDILSDVHIGRVSFRTAGEMATVIDKILAYERKPPMDDTSWYGRACLQGDPSQSGITTIYTNQWVKGQLLAHGWAQVDTTWGGNFVTPMVSQVSQGVSAYGYRGYLGTSGISNGHVSALSNGGRLAMALLPTCDSGSFASASASRSEAWLRAPNGGAVAAIGTATIGTHTRYNNCYYLGAWDGLLNGGDHRIGVAHTQGKNDLYRGYFLSEPDHAEIWAVWNNVMGDPATEMWTGVPREYAVTYDNQVSTGGQALTVDVADGGLPVAGARVVVYHAGDGFQTAAVTDAAGRVVLDLPALTAGSASLTVTGHDYLPHLGGVTVGPVDASCTASGATIADGGDGLLNPGEAVALTPRLTNHGTTDAFNVTTEVTVLAGPAVIGSGSLVFGTITSGAEVAATTAATLTVAPDAEDGATVTLLLTSTDGTDTWTSLWSGAVHAAGFQVSDLDLADFGGSLDPGESGRFDLTLTNFGSLDATAVSATLTVDSPWVIVDDPTADFGDVVSGGTGRDLVAPFALSVASGCFGGHLATYELAVTYGGGLQATTRGAVTIGTAATDQPTGPDAYGYYAFDNTDTGSGVAPVYDWVAIDPDNGGAGTDLGLGDFGWEQDDTRTIDLPFSFGFYGDSYDKVSICSNGWLAMGTTPLNFYRNFPLPASHSAGALIAPFWDNLNQTGTHKVYTWYDAAGHRFIIQWYQMPNDFSGAVQNFEAILLDPAYHVTPTGDGMILFQYAQVGNTDARDGYATVGIQNMARTTGVNYSYWNQYDAGAAPLAAGRAILFLPAIEIALPTAAVTPGAADLVLAPDTQATNYLHIENTGQEGSVLTYSIAKVDPAAVAGAKTALVTKSLAAGDDPTVNPTNLENSQVVILADTYDSGATVALPIQVTCSSPDQEWLSQLDLDLPAGVTATAATNFPAHNGSIDWNGQTGNGVTTTWGGSGGGFPYLDNGETAQATLTVTFDPTLAGDVVIGWSVFGDNWGNPPHTATGEIILTATAPSITVLAPTAGDIVEIGTTVDVLFAAVNGPQTVDIELQREDGGAWESLATGVPAAAAAWAWTVDGPPGATTRLRITDADDPALVGTSGVFGIGRNLDWLQIPVATGQVAYGATTDVAFTVDATGLGDGLYEARLVVTHNGGASVAIPVSLTVFSATAVGDLPAATTLLGNHPNPFNPQTTISFTLPGDEDVSLRVYSARGALVRSLLQGHQPAGVHHVVWDGRDNRGGMVASGVYFYRLQAAAGNFTGKMVLAK